MIRTRDFSLCLKHGYMNPNLGMNLHNIKQLERRTIIFSLSMCDLIQDMLVSSDLGDFMVPDNVTHLESLERYHDSVTEWACRAYLYDRMLSSSDASIDCNTSAIYAFLRYRCL